MTYYLQEVVGSNGKTYESEDGRHIIELNSVAKWNYILDYELEDSDYSLDKLESRNDLETI